MLLLLDLKLSAVLEGPLDDVGLIRGALDELALLKLRPELAEVLELDQVPDIAEGRLDDGRLANRGGGGYASGHDEFGVTIEIVEIGSVKLWMDFFWWG